MWALSSSISPRSTIFNPFSAFTPYIVITMHFSSFLISLYLFLFCFELVSKPLEREAHILGLPVLHGAGWAWCWVGTVLDGHSAGRTQSR